MLKREDERWLSENYGLSYCTSHKQYYDGESGCQLCQPGGLRLKNKIEEAPALQVCPECDQNSILWRKDLGRYNCLNIDCRGTFTPEQITQNARASTVRDESERSFKIWSMLLERKHESDV